MLPDTSPCVHLAAMEEHFRVWEDGSGEVTLDMDDVYLRRGKGRTVDQWGCVQKEGTRVLGIRGRRAVGVDFSDRCGARGLVVPVDTVSAAGRKAWQMHLPQGVGSAKAGERFF